MHLLQKMGWRPGEGLGKEKNGSLQPLLLEVKLDKRGLVADEEVNDHLIHSGLICWVQCVSSDISDTTKSTGKSAGGEEEAASVVDDSNGKTDHGEQASRFTARRTMCQTKIRRTFL